MTNLNKKLTRNDKIKILNEFYSNGFNPMLFKKPKTYVFIQDLRCMDSFIMEGKRYSELEIKEFKNDLNKLNVYLINAELFKYDELNKIIIVVFKPGKTIL